MSKPTVKGLTKKFSVKDYLGDENFDIPNGSCPKSSPASPDVNLQLLPFCGFLRSIEGSLQPHADMESHPPKEEDQRREKHNVENEVFVHLPSIGQFGVV
jgi:hypothetical protein